MQAFNFCDEIISNNYFAKDQIIKKNKNLASKISVIWNFVDFKSINLRANKSLNYPDFFDFKKPLIVSVGNLTTIKDRSTLIKAFHILNLKIPSNLVILGDGPNRVKCEKLIIELGLSNSVFLIGQNINPYSWIKNSDLYVSSSLSEGCPNNIIESIILKKKIVATDCKGDTSRLLKSTKNSKLVKVGDFKAMAQAFELMLSKSIRESPSTKNFIEIIKKSPKKYIEILCL